MNKPVSPFCSTIKIRIAPRGEGVLSGLRFAVKDVFDVAGHVTGAGNPDWLRTHAPADRTAPVVDAMLDAGGELLGKTMTDELAYSLNGENAHYGTPLNPKAPLRVPGGSSSGSASAVASGLVDVALGTDCAGSVRLPSSYCGLFGIRSSHGRIPLEGAVPLAHSFDTVGWFASNPAHLRRVGEALMSPDASAWRPTRLLLPMDVFEAAGPAVAMALARSLEHLQGQFDEVREVRLQDGDLSQWVQAFRLLQAREAWQAHGAWISSVQPDFGPGIRERFQFASTVTEDDTRPAAGVRQEARSRLAELLDDRTVMCMPSSPGPAPLIGTGQQALEGFRTRAFRILCAAGLASLPQVSLPVASLEDAPLGLSLVGPAGCDMGLLALAESLAPSLISV